LAGREGKEINYKTEATRQLRSENVVLKVDYLTQRMWNQIFNIG